MWLLRSKKVLIGPCENDVSYGSDHTAVAESLKYFGVHRSPFGFKSQYMVRKYAHLAYSSTSLSFAIQGIYTQDQHLIAGMATSTAFNNKVEDCIRKLYLEEYPHMKTSTVNAIAVSVRNYNASMAKQAYGVITSSVGIS